tara:strand:- start:23 stop:352 length:330 start_codon:yes stop_codon:yes gene_type:complete
MNEEEIIKVLQYYKEKREYDRYRYHNYLKNDPEWVDKQKKWNRESYHKHRDKRLEYNNKNKDIINTKNLYRWYYKNNKQDDFKLKFPDKYKLLVDMNFKLVNPNPPQSP